MRFRVQLAKARACDVAAPPVFRVIPEKSLHDAQHCPRSKRQSHSVGLMMMFCVSSCFCFVELYFVFVDTVLEMGEHG